MNPNEPSSHKQLWISLGDFKARHEKENLCAYLSTRGKHKGFVCGACPINTETNSSRLRWRCQTDLDKVGDIDQKMTLPPPVDASRRAPPGGLDPSLKTRAHHKPTEIKLGGGFLSYKIDLDTLSPEFRSSVKLDSERKYGQTIIIEKIGTWYRMIFAVVSDENSNLFFMELTPEQFQMVIGMKTE